MNFKDTPYMSEVVAELNVPYEGTCRFGVNEKNQFCVAIKGEDDERVIIRGSIKQDVYFAAMYIGDTRICAGTGEVIDVVDEKWLRLTMAYEKGLGARGNVAVLIRQY